MEDIKQEEVVEERDGVQEDDDILDLINGEPKDGIEDEDDLDELEPQDGDSLEVLKTKLAARNKIIRQREKAISRMQEELEKKQSGAMSPEDVVKLLQQREQEVEQKPEEVTIEQLKEQFEEDPSSIVDLVLKQNQILEQKLANVLERRDQHFLKKIGKDAGGAPPEIRQLAERLKSRPEYEGFNEEQLLTVAKTLSPLKGKVGRVPASIGSGSLPMTASNADVERVSKSALEAMGYGDEE